jgi:hypothetical protein
MTFALSQVLERNRQWPSARGEFAEQSAVQIMHLRANEDGDPNPVAPDPAVFERWRGPSCVRIQNDVLAKYRILSHGFEDDGLPGKASGF